MVIRCRRSALSPHLPARVSLADKEPPAHSAGLPIKSCAEKANTSSLRGLHKTLLLVDIKHVAISALVSQRKLYHTHDEVASWLGFNIGTKHITGGEGWSVCDCMVR